MVNIPGLMEPPITVSGRITKLMVTGFICGLMAASITVLGQIMICRAMEFISIQMVLGMMDSI